MPSPKHPCPVPSQDTCEALALDRCLMKMTSLLLLLALKTVAQPLAPADYGLKHFTLEDKALGMVSFYVDTTNLTKQAPILLSINGSGGTPLCLLVRNEYSGAFFNAFDTNLLSKTVADYHFVVLDKPGTPFADSVIVEDERFTEAVQAYEFSEEYHQMLSLDWRVNATRRVLDFLLEEGSYDQTKIIAWGFSEGGQVVPRLAAEDKRITHVVSVAGSGLNQFFDDITRYRVKADAGELTHQQAQDSIDAKLAIIQDIYAQPYATDRFYAGHTYLRWASFAAVDPLEYLKKLTIPIYMLAGSADGNSPIYGLDYVPLEFLRLHRTNLTYEVCVGCDHFQNREVMVNEEAVIESLGEEYIVKILDWLEEN